MALEVLLKYLMHVQGRRWYFLKTDGKCLLGGCHLYYILKNGFGKDKLDILGRRNFVIKGRRESSTVLGQGLKLRHHVGQAGNPDGTYSNRWHPCMSKL